jgi:hypothetical protein
MRVSVAPGTVGLAIGDTGEAETHASSDAKETDRFDANHLACGRNILH